MRGPLVISYTDYLRQLTLLLGDPVYRGTNVIKGKGQAVLLIPGFLAGDWSLLQMSGWLNRIGYRTYFSGIDWNVDCPNNTAKKLQWRLEQLTAESVGPLAVIGHSLGGLLARFLGANFPAQVRHIIALGSPLDVSTPDRVHPMVQVAFQLLAPLRARGDPAFRACGRPTCSCHFAQTAFSPLPSAVRLTSIFSKQDKVVDWRASVDPDGDNIEVSGGHLGLIVNREVYRVVAETLDNRLAGVPAQAATAS
ncbi:MAG: esterase/lipase family protein [Candidatus Binatia bacterium]